ncbi:MAG TPA: hypothetical protein VGG19_12320 [Tepidisphaeraceae bacterium]|jgi:hypothetical protein
MNSSRWIIFILILQIVILAGQWVGQPSLPRAMAQIPDAGAQRNDMLEQQRLTNEKLDHLIALFENGDAKVKATLPDKH